MSPRACDDLEFKLRIALNSANDGGYFLTSFGDDRVNQLAAIVFIEVAVGTRIPRPRTNACRVGVKSLPDSTAIVGPNSVNS